MMDLLLCKTRTRRIAIIAMDYRPLINEHCSDLIDGDMPISYCRCGAPGTWIASKRRVISWERRMAARKKATRKQSPSRKRSAGNTPRDALALLRADHQAVQELFDKFEKTRSDERNGAIAQQICNELTVHAQIEEEIFYPAAREA